MHHSIQCQMSIGTSDVNTRHCDALRRKPFADYQNNPEWFLDDPMLKIKHPETGENNETQKRQQLIAPLHFLFCSGGLLVTP